MSGRAPAHGPLGTQRRIPRAGAPGAGGDRPTASDGLRVPVDAFGVAVLSPPWNCLRPVDAMLLLHDP